MYLDQLIGKAFTNFRIRGDLLEFFVQKFDWFCLINQRGDRRKEKCDRFREILPEHQLPEGVLVRAGCSHGMNRCNGTIVPHERSPRLPRKRPDRKVALGWQTGMLGFDQSFSFVNERSQSIQHLSIHLLPQAALVGFQKPF
jgi:hypothetical protein